MDDLISRSALKEWLTRPTGFRANCEDCTEIDCLDCIIGEAIDNAPAVDAETVIKSLPYVKEALEMAKQTIAPVIRCKDCYYWMKAKVNKKGFLICPASGMEITANDYCSYAEKRECNYDR